jgi:hypothetical protein
MLVVTTHRSTYLLEPDLHLLLQVPGGTDCGFPQGVWHRALLEQAPRVGEPLFCTIVASDGETLGMRTSAVRWVGPPPSTPAYVDATIAAYARQPRPL